MSKQKIITIIILFMMLSNIGTPIAFAVSEKSKDVQEEQKIEESSQIPEDENNTRIEDESKIEHDENNFSQEENKKENQEEIEKQEIALPEETSEIEQSYLFKNEEDKIEGITDDLLQSETRFSASININGYRIETYLSKDIYYLFVPKTVNIKNLEIQYEYGVEIKEVSSGIVDNTNKKLINDFTNHNTLKIVAKDDTSYTIQVMQSDLPSMCIDLKEDITLDTVHAGTKDVKYGATLQIMGAIDSKYDISDDRMEFKGRGNSTWKMDKRGYQIKLSSKQNLLGIGNGKSKKWVLLANQVDRTLLRNKIAYDLGVETSLTNIPNATFIDLFINGEYIGNYLLCDKVETGSSRVNLRDPKGVLVEIDNEYGELEDDYFTTANSHTTFVLKESYAGDEDLGSIAEQEAFNSFQIAINQWEEALDNPDTTWEEIQTMIDVESFARLYLVMELAQDPDGFYSSTYFYKDGDKDVIHAGPVWDFDTALGYNKVESRGGNAVGDFILRYKTTWYTYLFQYDEFNQFVNKIYQDEISGKFHSIGDKIDTIIATMPKSIAMNFVRWDNLLGNTLDNPTATPTTPNGTTYQEEVQYLRNWIAKRVTYMDERYRSYNVAYKTHVQDYGWEDAKKDGQTAGTMGESKRIESITVALSDALKNAHISYQTHVQDVGWQGWVSDGEISGTEGQSKRLEALRIKLKGIPNYSVMYRVHVQNIGWQEWKYNGDMAGTEGKSLRIEAIEIRVVKTNYYGQKTASQTANINYASHIQDVGWSGWGCDGETIGTQNLSYRLEGIKIAINSNRISNTNITYQVHVQDVGWQAWVSNGAFAGTEGQSKRLEAIRIQLDNPNYAVRYRTYIQNIGWGPWVVDGQIAGTEGQSLRLEAIEIEVVQK